MKNISNKLMTTGAFLACTFLTPVAQANFIEQILNNPRVQALLSRPAEIVNQSKQCAAPAFRQANSPLCVDVDNATAASKMPFEMRTVMTNRISAQALRDLCLAAQTTAQQNNYLCSELAKADKDFASAAAAARIVPQQSTTNDLSN